MTWLRQLYRTYENNTEVIGEFQKKHNDQEFALIPVSHTTQQAQIEVSLDQDGNFVSAKVVDKNEASTVIPCTEASGSRTSAPVPHPLHDKLMYVAGDYLQYGGTAKKTNPHEDYLKQLKAWCDSEYAHPKVKSVYTYLCKGQLVKDLVEAKILYVDEKGRFIEKWSKELEEQYGFRPDIYRLVTSNQSDAFVRFAVNVIGEPESRLWRDKSVYESFIRYYESTLQVKDLCYISGEERSSTERHASRIRHAADMAKLISANDTSGFTFRGRFKQSKDAASISYEVSQKAHNALKWLVEKQGYTIDGKVFLVWGTDNHEVPDPYADTTSLHGIYDEVEQATVGDRAHQAYANQVSLAIAGYKHDLEYQPEVNIMILEAATPGRMAIVYYREMNKELFLDRIEAWHKSCYWLHRYKKDENNQILQFKGAPATRDIAFAAYGSKASDKIVKGLMERMLPSIVDERAIPLDIVRSAINRASNPVAMEGWEWEKTLSITCALVRKTYEKEGFEVGLDVTNDNRDYLFGRLLAIADVLERSSLDPDEKRATNAIRYMNAFAQRPQRTWTIIQSNLQPHQAKLGAKLKYFNSLLDEVGSMLKPEDFTDKPLSGLYLLGFYSQRHDLYKSKKEKEAEKEQAEEKGEI
ncbi:type I-C CRISPR-associated protein Cas8c/Csd1 [Paenibacillus sp. 32O-W]|uniref:type I-C CRISPR-associated protein Cas8c/Csd1 n=1 Tax=Paenibacillus sp. 32O-W TaxID=1695218 RepID=UPI00119EA5CC|nr:type I-C CRISPR-associated protein Cas8c/Csd1 [Paenibacillus sp. 32O-W]